MNDIITKLYRYYCATPKVSTDSRAIEEGSIFFALKGDNFDGNTYAEAALNKGAALAVVDNATFELNERCILVDDVLKTLQQLGHFHRKMLNIPIIGITGSNGKTTTKELVNAVLQTTFNCKATKGNLNNHIGVPLTLLSFDSETEMAIVEMGANHPGEIAELCALSEPGYGIVTNIGRAHLEGFLTVENIIDTKTALYRSVAGKDGCLFVNADDPILMKHSEGIKAITYSAHGKGDINAQIAAYNPSLAVNFEGEHIQTHLFGTYNIYNVLAAITTGMYFGVAKEAIADSLCAYQPKNNRSQLIKSATNTIVMDAYNANPSSMEAALRSFALTTGTNKTLILGDMLELGAEKEAAHTSIINLIQELGISDVYLTGPIFCEVCKAAFKTFETSAALKKHIENHPLSSRIILIKGSRGIKLEVVLPLL